LTLRCGTTIIKSLLQNVSFPRFECGNTGI
jgi:hypothetical protein